MGQFHPKELLPTRIPPPKSRRTDLAKARVGKALPGWLSGRLNLSQNKQSSSFQLLFPTGLVCSPFLCRALTHQALITACRYKHALLPGKKVHYFSLKWRALCSCLGNVNTCNMSLKQALPSELGGSCKRGCLHQFWEVL